MSREINRSKQRMGNHNNEQHGGAAGTQALSTGAPFTGLALGVLQDVRNEYNQAGLVSMLEERALRLTCVSDIYFKLILGSMQDEDVKKLDSYVARYGWLCNSSIRALALLRDAKGKEKGGVSAADVLEAIRSAKDDDTD